VKKKFVIHNFTNITPGKLTHRIMECIKRYSPGATNGTKGERKRENEGKGRQKKEKDRERRNEGERKKEGRTERKSEGQCVGG